MIINRIYETQNLLSLKLISFVVGQRTYQHSCTTFAPNILLPHKCVHLASYTRCAGTTRFCSCHTAVTIVRLKPNENVRGTTFSQY